MAELLRDVSHALYHADDLPGCPHLSQSGALTLLQKSPLHLWYSHPKLGGNHVEDNTDATDNGSLVHSLLVGAGPDIAVAPDDFKDWRGKRADFRDEARERGAIPIVAPRWEAVQVAASVLRKNIEALGIPLDDCEKEVTILWDDGETHCKARLDLLCLAVDIPEGHDAHLSGDLRAPLRQHFPVSSARIWDLKVTALSPDRFKHGLISYGLDIQAHAYTQAVAAVFPELAGRIGFEFLLCEPEPPYSVALVPVGESMLIFGGMRWGRALRIWRKCMESGDWPGYGLQAPAEAKPWDIENELVAGGAELVATGDPAWISEEANHE